MSVFDRVLTNARKQQRRIVLPETQDERVLQAAANAVAKDIAAPILLGDTANIQSTMNAIGLSTEGLELVDPASDPRRDHYAALLTEKRAHRGMTHEKALDALNTPITYACMMVAAEDADGCVAGAITATADVVRNAMRCVGKREGEALISSCFVMLLKAEHPVSDVMVIGDCALVIDPDAKQLSSIAVATAETAKQLLDIEPQVAMLSFSTAGSARHTAVTKVVQATEQAKTARPDWRIIGEVQLDAAVMPDILARKSPEQATDEPCNVLIFPDLNAGNIGYKLIERFGGAQAIGPILQGLNRPVNDLSRGCNTNDIVNIMAVTAAQVRD